MINHFYHIYADGLWQEPVDEHINNLKRYGLADELDGFYIGLVGSEENRKLVIEKVKEYDIDFSVVAEADEGWEQVTMNKVSDFTQDNDGLIFYAHTKGAHDPSPINIAWRKSMCYFNIVMWKNIKAHFAIMDIDTMGCHWCVNTYWGGTYWWAKAEYLRTLGYPKTDDRWDAEKWIGYGQPRIVDMNPGWPAFERFVTAW